VVRVSPSVTRMPEAILRSAQDDRASRTAFSVWTDALPHPGWLNMAIDTALLERAEAGERWLRLYTWDPPCLSFGRHEPAARRYDAERIETLGLPVVRRPTGGRAVWHAQELTYAVAVPIATLGSLQESYREIHLLLRDALRSLGAAAELAPAGRPNPVDAGACFASPTGGEVMIAGRKVVGSAQLRQGTALLQHGSVLLDGDQATVAAVSRGAAPADLSAPLSQVLGRPVGWAEAAEAIVAAVEARWGLPSARAHSPDAILDRAMAHAERFRSTSWTWQGTSPR
jgi:lipoyl(octanoyl) transferase